MDISCIQQALKYAGHNQLDHLEGFKELLRFPSISQDTAFQPQLLACVDWLVDRNDAYRFGKLQGSAHRGQSRRLWGLVARGRRETDSARLCPLRCAACWR